MDLTRLLGQRIQKSIFLAWRALAAGQERVPVPGLCNLYFFFPLPSKNKPLRSSAPDVPALHGLFRSSLLIGCYSPSATSKYNLRGKNTWEHLQLLWERCSKLALYLITKKLRTSSLLMDYISSFSLFKHTDLHSTCWQIVIF